MTVLGDKNYLFITDYDQNVLAEIKEFQTNIFFLKETSMNIYSLKLDKLSMSYGTSNLQAL